MRMDKKCILVMKIIFINCLFLLLYYFLLKDGNEIQANFLKFVWMLIIASTNFLIINKALDPVNQTNESETQEEIYSGNGSIIDGKKCLIII